MTVEVESHESTIKNLRSKLHQYTLVEDDTVPAYLRHPNEKVQIETYLLLYIYIIIVCYEPIILLCVCRN